MKNILSRPVLALFLVLISAMTCCSKPQESGTSDFGKKKGGDIIIPLEDTQKVHETTYYSNPVYKDSASADPSIIRVGKYIYSYSTGDNIHILRSEDMVNWTFIGKAFMKCPNWIKKADGSNPGVWAPDVNLIGGRYVMYYSLSGAHKGIGVAVASSPEGPFVDMGKLIEDGDFAVPNNKGENVSIAYTIDPCYWEEDDGTKYIIWGSFRRIFIARLTNDGLALLHPDGSDTKVIGCAQWEGSMIYRKNGYYYYLGSNGNPLNGEKSDYRAQVARSASLFGPYVSKDGKNLANSDKMTPLLYSNDEFLAPGHVSEIITDDAGDEWIAYHCYIRGKANQLKRILFIDKIDWDKDGWPVINGGNGPTSRSVAPYFEKK